MLPEADVALLVCLNDRIGDHGQNGVSECAKRLGGTSSISIMVHLTSFSTSTARSTASATSTITPALHGALNARPRPSTFMPSEPDSPLRGDRHPAMMACDRTSAVKGKGVSVRVALGGRRTIRIKKYTQ